MTLIFKVQAGLRLNPAKLVKCKISCRNIVAYAILPESEAGSQIYICDLITPWQVFKVTSSKFYLNLLDWNSTGELLLCGYINGLVEIWTTNKVINSWHLIYKANFAGERIICATFFQKGKDVFFQSQKKDLPSYADKFERLEYRPTVELFGCTPAEGVVVITSSSLIGAFIIPQIKEDINQSTELPTFTQNIAPIRFSITQCSICYCPNGRLKIIVNCGQKPRILYCFTARIKLDGGNNLLIICETIPLLFLNIEDSSQISHMGWVMSNKDEFLYIAYSTEESSYVEQWHLSKKHQAIHKLLQKNKGDFIQYEAWENIVKTRYSTEITDICSSKLLFPNAQFFVILKGNEVQGIEPGIKKNNVTLFDRTKMEDRGIQTKFVATDVTPMNQILLVFDNFGQMYAIQVANQVPDKSFKMINLTLQTSLLEYCIITGIDSSDILMLNMMNLDMLIEKLTENFTKQSTITRHFYYSNFLCLKSNMCRIQSRQQDFDKLIFLHTISITFKSLLRPADLSCQDKVPADNLAIILSDPSADIDKVLLSLDAKDFTVEPLTVHSMQQLIQWVSDLALTILKKLPNEVIKAKMCKKQGYDISRDNVALGSIRELLVMIRIWGLLNPQCLPSYCKSVENIDILATLFRLLTRLAQNTAEPDDLLLDECSLLATQVLSPQRQYNNPATLLNSHFSLYKSSPFIFTEGVEPVSLQDIKYDEVVFASDLKDGVSNLHLGTKNVALKNCVRCGLVNTLQHTAKTTAMKAWSQRWLYCHCGGYWIKELK